MRGDEFIPRAHSDVGLIGEKTIHAELEEALRLAHRVAERRDGRSL